MTDLRKLLDETMPGPWFIEGLQIMAPDGDDTPWSVAALHDCCGRKETMPANARLIVMAPDLAAALLKAEEALANIARQKKTDEIETEYEAECADFEAGYDACVDIARATLTEIRKLTGASA